MSLLFLLPALKPLFMWLCSIDLPCSLASQGKAGHLHGRIVIDSKRCEASHDPTEALGRLESSVNVKDQPIDPPLISEYAFSLHGKQCQCQRPANTDRPTNHCQLLLGAGVLGFWSE